MSDRVSLMAAAMLVAGSLEGLETQGQPDFSGTWVIERVEFQGPQRNTGSGRREGSRGGGDMRGGGGRGGRGRGAIVGPPYQEGDRVTLRQTNEALIVIDEGRSLMSSYPFDGRETSNPGPGDSTITSTAKWEAVALVIESVVSVVGPQGDITLNTREVWSLSEDGNTMALVMTGKMPFGTLSSTVTLVRIGDF